MANAAADCGIIKDVDDRFGRAADIDADRSAPNRAHGEQHMLEHEGDALDRLSRIADRARLQHAGAACAVARVKGASRWRSRAYRPPLTRAGFAVAGR
jgi:hypothetical protein